MKPLKLLTNILLCLMLGVTSAAAEETEPVPPSESSVTEPGELPEETEEQPSLEPQETGEEAPAEISEETDGELSEEDDEEDIPKESNPEEEEKDPEAEEDALSEALNAKQEEADPEEEKGYIVPEGFVLQPKDREAKQAVLSHGMKDELEGMEEGKDYAEREVILYCDEKAYAETCAEIFHGTLVSYDLGIGVIELNEGESLKNAVLASWTREDLPFIEPDYLVELDEPEYEEEDLSEGSSVLGYNLPKTKTWESTVYSLFDKPDPYLMDPTASTYQWFHEAVGSYAAWSAGMGKDDILVGVVDYSVNENHEELAGKVSSEDIGCGYYLGTGHGTSVAGVIAAIANNGKGGAGVAPDVRILSINIFKNTTTATTSNIVKAILKAVECNVDVINFSVGSRKYSRVEEEAVDKAYENGIPFVAAAGNDGSNIQVFPSAYKNAIAVAASDRNGLRAYFSNYGPWITVSAPGVQMRLPSSSWSDPSSRYTTTSGTSFAAPVVTGALALYMSKMGKINGDEAVEILSRSTTAAGSQGMGYGIISIEKMFEADTAGAEIHVFDRDGNEITSFVNPLEEGAYITLESRDPGDRDVLAYTTDGSEVTVADGQIVNGEIYSRGQHIEVDSFPKNSTITIKAAAFSSFGAAGQKASLTIQTPVPHVVYKIKTVALDPKASRLYLPDNAKGRGHVVLNVSTLINTAGQNVSLDTVPHTWISSDTAVAEVDETGTVTAKGVGSANIILKILDGSGKMAGCAVKVLQYVERIEINGQAAVSPGFDTEYTATVFPSSASVKEVVWSIKNPVEGVTLSSTGMLRVSSDVAAPTAVTIAAQAADGSKTISKKKIFIVPKATSVKIRTDDPRAVYTSKGVLKNITLFTSDLMDSAHSSQDEHIATFTAKINGNKVPPIWNSSNPAVAVVDQSGAVTAVGTGKTTITCTANDGSGKSASFIVLVTVPVSYMRLSFGNHTSLAVGKAIYLKKFVSYGTAYGAPTKRSVTWSIDKVVSSSSRRETDITREVLSDMSIVLAKGVLRANPSLKNHVDFKNELVYVTLRAVSDDGTGYTDTVRILVTGELEALQFAPIDGQYYECLPNIGYTTYLYSQYPIKYDIHTTDPSVAGAYIDYSSETPADFEYIKDGQVYVCSGYQYRVRIYTAYENTGITKIVVKSLDGTNRKAALYVRVSNP
ncbi:MAG: S8 family serine peptidase [Solobacterium sp.]|nr:S8 family serine peptidase [Solobacterium sp.]